MIDETLFNHSNNEVVLILIDPTDLSDIANHPNGKPYDFITKGVTLMELYIGCNVFSSENGFITYNSIGEIIIKLDGELPLENNVNFNSFIKIYDDNHPLGQFITSKLSLTVVDPSAC